MRSIVPPAWVPATAYGRHMPNTRRLEYEVDVNGGQRAAAFHALLASGFLLVGAAAWWLPAQIVGTSSGARWLVAVVSVAGAALFGSLAVRFGRRSRSGVPLITLQPDALVDHGSAVFSGVGRIPWSEIEDIRLGRYHSLPCVEIVLRDRETVLQELSWTERLGRSARLGYPALAFRGPLLPKPAEAMAEEMRAFLESVRR